MVQSERVRQLNNVEPEIKGPVLYVMGREQRVNDNWALLYAQELANRIKQPLVVAFFIVPNFLHGSQRHNDWLISSLKDVEQGLSKLNIPFEVEAGDWSKKVIEFSSKIKASQVVFDFNPLEPVRSWRYEVAKSILVPVFEVDAHNIVPCWEASDKAEFAAYTFRPKIHRLLAKYLIEFPKIKPAKNIYSGRLPKIDWESLSKFRKTAVELPLIAGLTAGEKAAKQQLKKFVTHKLKGYSTLRNDPNQDHTSNLSAYLRWGNISAATVALTVKNTPGQKDDKDAFLEELIVRRELSDNFVFYNPAYNQVSGAPTWAQISIKKHQKDQREFLYTYKEFENSHTHDDLWNAAQTQMVREGKMHGYLRMYWAKKILEWTKDVETAIDIALKLNDTYNLDGRDSNGVVGVMWSIAGVHDRAWPVRPIFGQIRYMNFNGCKRKFDVAEFVARYSSQPTIFK
jgi:deoxyribodipyrimidine photo-lyase